MMSSEEFENLCEGFEVSVIRSMMVRPCQPIKNEIIPLSGLDRVSPVPLYTIFFYRAEDGNDKPEDEIKENKVNKGGGSEDEEDSEENTIIQALQRVLATWYPAAGRFIINPDSTKLEIECNGAGVPVYVASTDVTIQDLGTLWDYKHFYEKLAPKSACDVPTLSEKPLVVAQLTRFACGGLAIGFGSSHCLFDGLGAFNFLRAWAYHTTGSEEEQDEALQNPNHSRKDLIMIVGNDDDDKNSSSSKSMLIQQQLYSTPVQDLCCIPMKANAADDQSWETTLLEQAHLSNQSCLLKTFPIQADVIQALKSRAMADQQPPTRFSSFDILAAHIWRARVRALNIEPETRVCLQFPVDARSRTVKPLGTNFSGNAFILASASCTAAQVTGEAFAATAERVRAAKEAVNAEYIQSFIKALESCNKFLPSMRELTIVSDWRKLPLHSLNFAAGKLQSACSVPLATPVPQTAYIMPSPGPLHALHLRIGLLAHQIPAFQFYLFGIS